MGELLVEDGLAAVGGDVVGPAGATLVVVKVVDGQTELVMGAVLYTLLLGESIVHQLAPVYKGLLLDDREVGLCKGVRHS